MNRDLFRLSSLANVVGRANARRLLAGDALHASAARRVVVAPASCFQCNMKKFNDCFASREDGSQGPRASTDACSALQVGMSNVQQFVQQRGLIIVTLSVQIAI